MQTTKYSPSTKTIAVIVSTFFTFCGLAFSQNIAPRTVWSQPIYLNVTTGGQIQCGVTSGTVFNIASSFSYPGTTTGGWDGLPTTSHDESAWVSSIHVTTVTAGSNYTVTAAGSYYSLSRSVVSHDHYIEVDDSFTAKSADVGIMQKIYTNLPSFNKANVYLGGIPVTATNLADTNLVNTLSTFPFTLINLDNWTLGAAWLVSPSSATANYVLDRYAYNPTFFYSNGTNGIGLTPVDDVSRIHAQKQLEAPSQTGGLVDYAFMLKASTNYTRTWYIYPSSTPNYFDFVNEMRRDLNVNFTIKGSSITAAIPNPSTAIPSGNLYQGYLATQAGTYLDAFLNSSANNYALLGANMPATFAQSGAQYVVANMPYFASGGSYYDAYGASFTTNVMTDTSRKTQLTNMVTKYHQATGVQVLAYFSPWACTYLTAPPSGFSANEAMQNSQPLLAFQVSNETQFAQAGSNFTYYYYLGNNYTNSSSYTYQNSGVISNMFSLGFDGIFCDQFDTFSDDPLTMYTTTDGYTADIDQTSYKITTERCSGTYVSLNEEAAIVTQVQNAGKTIIANTPPMSKTMSSYQFPRFYESPNGEAIDASRCHLYTPLLYPEYENLKAPSTPGEPANTDLANQLSTYLSNGGLMYYSFIPFNNQTGPNAALYANNIMQTLFPITPQELYPNYIIGAEKIVSQLVGTGYNYSFSDTSSLDALIYTSGYLAQTKWRNASSGGSNNINVPLTSGQIAVVRKIARGIPVPGDYDGDGKIDAAIYSPTEATFYIWKSSAPTGSGPTIIPFPGGQSTDIPLAGADYDGDGKADCAVFRPSTATFYVLRSSDSTLVSEQFGSPGDQPIVGDFDGDHKTDYAVWRPSTATFYYWPSSGGSTVTRAISGGQSTDVPLSRVNYDGDGKTDCAVFRPSTATFYVLRSSDSTLVSEQFGSPGDQPIGGDWDGDGKTDYAVWRPSTAIFYYWPSGGGSTVGIQYGSSTDQPAPASYEGSLSGSGHLITDPGIFRPSEGNIYMWLVGNSTQVINGISAGPGS